MPDEPLSTEHHQQAEGPRAQGTSGGVGLGGQDPNREPSENQAEQAPYKRPGLLKRTKDAFAGHRAREFYKNPMVWIEVIALGALFWYTHYAGQQADAAIRAAKAAKSAADTAVTSLRPWIKIDSIELRSAIGPMKALMFHWPITGELTPPTLQVKISLENVGHSVAEGIKVNPTLFFARFNDHWRSATIEQQKKFCSLEYRTDEEGMLFPSDSSDWYGGLGAPTPAESSAAVVIVCVNYSGAPGTNYHTEARATLRENDSVVIPIGVDAGAPSLRLEREMSGDHAN
jgi:hypothetical protein